MSKISKFEMYVFKTKPKFFKSRIRETLNLSTDADSRTDTIFEKLRDIFFLLKVRDFSPKKRSLRDFFKTKKI